RSWSASIATGARGPMLYPEVPTGEPTVAALEDWLDEGLGPAVRLLAYHYLLSDPARLVALVGGSLSLASRLAFKPLLRKLGPEIRRLYRIDDASAARAAATIHAAMATVGDRLRDGRPFLAGPAFSAADLTFASLSGPLLAWPDT